MRRFQEHSQCLVDQYDGYSLGEEGEEQHVHGRNTLGENIADNGGIKAAYDGYFNRHPERKEFVRFVRI